MSEKLAGDSTPPERVSIGKPYEPSTSIPPIVERAFDGGVTDIDWRTRYRTLLEEERDTRSAQLRGPGVATEFDSFA